MVMALSAVLIVMGIATLWIFVGIFFVGFGALVLYRAMRIRKAVALLQQQGTPLLQT